MPPKKKRVPSQERPEFKCVCKGGFHETLTECIMAANLQTHMDVTTCVIIGSRTFVTVLVGEDSQAFIIHRDLLLLHSNYFRNILTSLDSQVKAEAPKISTISVPDVKIEDESGVQIEHMISTASIASPSPDPTPPPSNPTITIPHIEAPQFSHFISFLYSGRITFKIREINTPVNNDWPSLWKLGSKLQSASFQNFCMDSLRCSVPVQTGCWPNPAQAAHIYALTEDEPKAEYGGGAGGRCRLRLLVANCLAAHNPFESFEVGSEQYGAWAGLFGRVQALGMDVLRAGGKRWVRVQPWDWELRGAYLVDEKGVMERWEEIILERRSEVEVDVVAVQEGCVRSLLEYAHLHRAK